MRPETAYRKVMKAFEFWYKDKDTSKLHKCKFALKTLIKKDRINMYRLNEKWGCPHEPTPDLTKFNYQNYEGELMYISDRFNSTRRLAWLYHGLITGLIK